MYLESFCKTRNLEMGSICSENQNPSPGPSNVNPKLTQDSQDEEDMGPSRVSSEDEDQ